MEPPAAAQLAIRAARREILSARPDAPVVSPRRGGGGTRGAARPDGASHRLRSAAAAALRHVADALEPRPAALTSCLETPHGGC